MWNAFLTHLWLMQFVSEKSIRQQDQGDAGCLTGKNLSWILIQCKEVFACLKGFSLAYLSQIVILSGVGASFSVVALMQTEEQIPPGIRSCSAPPSIQSRSSTVLRERLRQTKKSLKHYCDCFLQTLWFDFNKGFVWQKIDGNLLDTCFPSYQTWR